MSARQRKRAMNQLTRDDGDFSASSSSEEDFLPRRTAQSATFNLLHPAADDSSTSPSEASSLHGDELEDEQLRQAIAASLEQPCSEPGPSSGCTAQHLSNKERRAARRAEPAEPAEVEPAPPAAPAVPPAAEVVPEASLNLWKLESKHLDVTYEQGGLFGRAAVRAAAAAERAARPQRRGAPGGGAHDQGLTARTARSLLVRPKEHWPLAGGGLGMEVDREVEERASTSQSAPGLPPATWFLFTHSAAYRRGQTELEAAVESGDPHALQAVVEACVGGHLDGRPRAFGLLSARRSGLRTAGTSRFSYPANVDALLRLSDYCATTGQRELSQVCAAPT